MGYTREKSTKHHKAIFLGGPWVTRSMFFWKCNKQGPSTKIPHKIKKCFDSLAQNSRRCPLACMNIFASAKIVQICPFFLTIPCAPWNRFSKRQRKDQGEAASCPLSKPFCYVGFLYTPPEQCGIKHPILQVGFNFHLIYS